MLILLLMKEESILLQVYLVHADMVSPQFWALKLDAPTFQLLDLLEMEHLALV